MSPSDFVVPPHWRWRESAVDPGPAVIFDMDGVLSSALDRQHHIKNGNRNWAAFFDEVGQDQLIDEMALLLSMLDADMRIILLTGRPLRVQPQTLEWLEKHRLRWDVLIMRAGGDYSQAREFKQTTVGDLRAYGFELHLAFEDDINNAEMFRKEDVPCVYIHSGYYDN